MYFIIVFSILSLLNVILSTIKSIITIKGGKVPAALVNAGYFSFYNIVLIFTVMDFSLLEKIIITFITNLIGIYIVKYFEERFTKIKLYKFELTTNKDKFESIKYYLDKNKISYNYIDIKKYIIFQLYCMTKQDSKIVIKISKQFNSKLFAANSVI